MDLVTSVKAYCQIGAGVETLQYCLQGVYNIGVALAVALAFLYIIYGAVEYLVGAATNQQAAGKGKIINALIGMLIIFSSGTVLYWINPQIFDARLLLYKVTSLEAPTLDLLEIGKGTEVSGEEPAPQPPPNTPPGRPYSRDGVTYGGNGDQSKADQHGVPLIKQTDSRWGSTPYTIANNPKQTISRSGCGLASLAMVIAHYKNIGPEGYKDLVTKLRKELIDKGYRTKNNGTSWSVFSSSKFLATYGLKGEFIGTSANSVFNALSKGPVIATMKPGPFTSGGHYVVLAKLKDVNGNNRLDDNDIIYINDPGRRDAKEASWGVVRASMKAAWYIRPS